MKHSKQDIINIGQELFRSNGYHATGISKILSASSIPKGTFYNYFSTKEEFARECLESYSNQIKKLIKTYINFSYLSPERRIKGYFDQLIKINQQEGADKGCLLMNFATEVGGQIPGIAKLATDEFEQWISMLTPTIEEAQSQGQFKSDIAANQIARMLYYSLYGGFSEMKNLRSTNRTAQQLENLFRLMRA